MRVTIEEVRHKAERINTTYGLKLSVEHRYNFYNVYNGGDGIAYGVRSAKDAEKIIDAFEAGLETGKAFEAGQEISGQ